MNTVTLAVARRFARLAPLLVVLLSAAPGVTRGGDPAVPAGDPWISPAALALSRDGATLFVASATSGQVLILDTATRKVVRTLTLPAAPSGLVLSADGNRLLVTCSAPESALAVLDWREGKTVAEIRVGSAALAPVLSPDGGTAYVCDRFSHAVSVVDLGRGIETRRIDVQREPIAAMLTADGRRLFVGNHLPVGRADVDVVSAQVTVIDVAEGRVIRHLALPNGGNLIRDVRLSPDGRHVCVTHTLARFQLPTTQVERGWMNANAFTLIDATEATILNTFLLDQVELGAANPWAAAWSDDGRSLLITHAGTHELSVIDFPALLQKLGRLPATIASRAGALGYVVSQSGTDVPNDLSFLEGLRRRIPLGGNGPRAIATRGSRVWVGNYFSESLSTLDLAAAPLRAVEVPLRASRPMTVARRGEALFNDATLCLEHWQSCASCHSSEARADALNWDLINDGKGNAKNTKSFSARI